VVALKSMRIANSTFVTIAILFAVSAYGKAEIHPDCIKHFKKEKAVPGKADCLWKCSLNQNIYLAEKMILCGSYCDQFCLNKEEKLAGDLADLYPGLTDQERLLSKKEPMKMIKAYKASWEAEAICLSMYSSSFQNDESDACRHFMWSALLQKQLGREFADQVLTAHEMNPEQPKVEKEMDFANNSLGIDEGSKLDKIGKFNEENLKTAFKEKLNTGKVKFLNKLPGRK
jgi:hypothetical protein